MNQLIVISAPSAAGKSTLIKKLLVENHELGFALSYTTRKIREGEKEGRDYYFIAKEDFEKKIAEDCFLEWKKVHAHYYGTSKTELERLKKINRKVILDIDVQGALELKKKKVKANYIFIVPPSLEILKQRLRQRATENEEQIQKRLATAKEELQYINQWKYTVINDSLEQALADLKKIIN